MSLEDPQTPVVPESFFSSGSMVVTDPGDSHQDFQPVSDLPPSHKVLVTTVSSDAHTWNLVFLQKVIEELGCEVVNLGPCVPDELLVSACLEHQPDLVVVSSVNGHGHQDGLRLIRSITQCDQLAQLPVVIGGKLGIDGGDDEERPAELLRAGFAGVFEDSPASLSLFRSFLAQLPSREEP